MVETITLQYHQNINNKVEQKELVFSKSLLKAPYNKESLFVMQVDGQSMQPTIKHEALVVADLSQKTFQNEAIFIVEYDHQVWIKQAQSHNGKRTFVSINPKFAHLVYEFNDARVIAKVLLTFTEL